MTEQEQILNMLAEAKITVDEASELLSALDSQKSVTKEEKKSGSARAKKIRIIIDSDMINGKKNNINLDLPLGLAKFATKFIGQDKLVDIESEGIDINGIIKVINLKDLEEGVIYETETVKNKKGAKSKIKIEVIWWRKY